MRDEGLGIRGFANGQLYDSSRPDYPATAINYFVSVFDTGPETRALDLGTMIAVDPSSSMRDALRASSPNVTVLDGSDVEIPVSDRSVDVVFVAQAFHWFDEVRALEEIHRVLVDGGGLGLIWNERDESVDWVGALSRAMQWDARQPYDVGKDFTPVIARGPFVDAERVTFQHTQTLTRIGLYQRVLSTSYISAMEEGEREALMKQDSEVAEQLREPIVLPYLSTAHSARATT